jgi:hypothetical protein
MPDSNRHFSWHIKLLLNIFFYFLITNNIFSYFYTTKLLLFPLLRTFQGSYMNYKWLKYLIDVTKLGILLQTVRATSSYRFRVKGGREVRDTDRSVVGFVHQQLVVIKFHNKFVETMWVPFVRWPFKNTEVVLSCLTRSWTVERKMYSRF